MGRPAKVDRDAIARAASAVGLHGLTMKAVADHLGVSVPGLYHHVRGRDDLVRLAAEYSVSQIHVPVDRDQHWSEWLLEWAEYARASFVANPELLGQFVHGTISIHRMFVHIDRVVGLLTRQGFTPAEALDAFELVSATALGVALAELREAEALQGHGIPVSDYHRVLADADPHELPHLRQLAAGLARERRTFEARIRTVLSGIAVERGGTEVRPARPARKRARNR